MNNPPQIELLRYQLRKRENAAKAVPYVSFILTHVALVLFLVLSFFIDRLLGSSPASGPIKIVLTVLAVAFLASEWVYAIVNSRRWKKDILLLLQLEQQHQQREEQEKYKRQEDLIAAEQFRNRVLQADLQRQRSQNGMPAGSPYMARSVRPPQLFPSSPMSNGNNTPFPPASTNNGNNMPFPPTSANNGNNTPFPPASANNGNGSQYPFPPMDTPPRLSYPPSNTKAPQFPFH